MPNMRFSFRQNKIRPRLFLLAVCLLTLSVIQTGCIRLWGGATYVNEKPGERVQKTYILDTYEFTNPNPPKADVQ